MDYPLANTYGVRSELFLQSADDYHRQRHRTNKKLNKLRRELKIITKDTKNYKDKEKITQIVAENYDMEPLFGDVLLYLVERDLLYAQETRLLLDVHSLKPKEKFLVSKYKKALQNAKHLLEVIKNETDDLKTLEILTYTAIIEGSIAITKKKYDISLYAFSIAKCAIHFLYNYQKLPETITKEFYYEIADGIIDPALKVSASSEKLNFTDLTELAKSQIFNIELIPYLYKAVKIIESHNATYVTPTSENNIDLLKEVKWGSYSAQLTSDDLSLAIMKINEELKNIDDKNTSSFDSPLISYQDAITLHTQEMERNSSNDEESNNQEQYIILTYLKYNYLLLRIRRDNTIMKDLDAQIVENQNSKKKLSTQKIIELLKDYLKINEGIAVSLVEINDLPGIANDDELVNLLNTVGVYFKVKNQQKLSQAYLISHQYKEALALIVNSSKLLQSCKEFNVELEGNLPTNKDLEKLKVEIEDEKSRLYTLTTYFNEINKEQSSFGSKYISDDISKFPKLSPSELLKHVYPLKFDFQPVNVKPVLFDIAYNYIDADTNDEDEINNNSNVVSHEVETSGNVDNEEDKKKSGFFGLFGR
ncbi:signal recognition particle subunit [Pichia kluyveri]|uniref:Signal recognition particle subunit SRP68 n=1 Tax=Pichia kluyveri TaxID=36015 RepID=A0AAV5QZM1_PICKL|nr:signal recognition particle subunit [Pichia kluyveri]